MSDYIYRVAIVRNRKLKKVVKEYKRYKHAQNKFNKILAENQVFYEKKFVKLDNMLRIKEELLLLKKNTGEKDIRKVFNDYGELVEEKVIGDWEILKKADYKIEEEFKVYGYKKRLTVPEILKDVLVPRLTGFYNIVCVYNKMVIYNDNDIDVILCRNIEETERLYNFIFDFVHTQGFFNLVFLGFANKTSRKALEKRLLEHMGVKKRELYRTYTRR